MALEEATRREQEATRREEAEAKNKLLQADIDAAQPKLEALRAIARNGETYTLTEAAKLMQIPAVCTLTTWMRQEKMLQKRPDKAMPTAKAIDKGVLTLELIHCRDGRNRTCTRVTSRGLVCIATHWFRTHPQPIQPGAAQTSAEPLALPARTVH